MSPGKEPDNIMVRYVDAVPKSLGFTHIDSYRKPTDGVWHPDTLKPLMAWNGGESIRLHYLGVSCFDPFVNGLHIDRGRVRYFSVSLSAASQTLFWTFLQNGSNSTALSRGNQGIGSAGERPEWLNKPQYVAFTAVRAYSHIQLRKLCVALRERSLPLDRREVLLLFRQSLYHLGDIESAADCVTGGPTQLKLSWRVDSEEGYVMLHKELELLVEELRESPKEHMTTHFLGEIAIFLTHWRPECRSLTRKVSDIYVAWAKDSVEKLEMIVVADSLDTNQICDEKGRHFIFYVHSLLCHRVGELSPEDIQRIVLLSVKARNIGDFRNSKMFAKDIIALEIELQGMMTEVAARLGAIPQDALVCAVRSVVNEPRDFVFREMEGRLLCYEAHICNSVSTDIISINVVSGVVLYNGLPPSSLPESIRQHPMYKRSFGSRNFEIVSKGGILRATRPILGCIYEFVQPEAQGTALLVKEIHVFPNGDETGLVLELLDGVTSDGWKDSLPVRLQEMHSHWYSRELETIFLRPISFLDREIDFIIQKDMNNNIDSNPESIPQWICYSVPSNYRELPAKDLLIKFTSDPSTFRQLVLYSPHLVGAILGKFENQAFIHSFITRKGTLIFSLPRFGLEFETSVSGSVSSLDFAGYHLSDCQLMPDTLMNFNQYLLLEDSRGQVKMITRNSPVTFDSNENVVKVASDPKCATPCIYYIYGVHPRFRYLMANNLADGLHLVALYAASSSSLPESRTGMTGDEVAISILRHQWVNRPLDKGESLHLSNVLQFCNRAPALKLLCIGLYQSSQKLNFLYSSIAPSVPVISDSLAATEYENSRMSICSCRTSLTADEEFEILTLRTKCMRNRLTLEYDHLEYKCISKTLEFKDIVTKTESNLRSLLTLSTSKSDIIPFPLREGTSDIGKKMIDDFSDSWTEYNNLTVLSITPENRVSAIQTCEECLLQIKFKREFLEKKLLVAIDTIPDGNRWDHASARLNKLSNLLPTITVLDLMSIADNRTRLRNFNPFFSSTSANYIWLDIITWLTLCVLEDRLSRIVYIGRNSCSAIGDEELVRELSVYRNWSPVEHPKWLIFEVEGSLQIRPSQYDVARTLIENKGAIAQLNMGEGKTRVILPMLILYWGAQGDSVVRLYFLSQLLKEAYAHLHRYLSSSVLGCKIFLLPFNRDVILTPEMAKMMHASAMQCIKSGGCLIMAREHRLSLHLKSYEIEKLGTTLSEATCVALKKLNDLNYIDMLDESEELLHHKIQLIYAVGDPIDIPGGQSRWIVTQAVLRSLKEDINVQKILTTANVSLQDTSGHQNTSETFPKIRLLAGEALDAVRMDLLRAVAKCVLTNPPYEMRWLRAVPPGMIKRIILFVTDSGELDEELLFHETCQLHSDDILALRGLLGFGNLMHCLQRIHRVNYGINRLSGSKRKRIAVPFRASDIPCERAEFAHPDIGIVFTFLSYYSDGLSESQFSQTLDILFSLGISEQEKIYGEWFALSKGSMTDEDKLKVDTVRKLDHTCSSQYDLLYTIYRHNIATVSAWLDWVVFPAESKQFPQQLSANAWNLVENKTNPPRGFSGTDDKKLLLPLQVHSHRTDEPQGARLLRGTNGKMLSMLLHHSHYEKIDQSGNTEVASTVDAAVKCDSDLPSWKLVMRHALATNCSAIIDAGALMVGASNLDVALYVLSILPRPEKNSVNSIKGILFFNTTAHVDEWQMRDAEGREWPRHSSPIKESECFVIFDESRCIGSDVKMKQDAVCLLTLGTGMCKDKLMQAAGRARMLGRGQTLILLGVYDIHEKIRECKALCSATTPVSTAISVLDVIEWVMGNTIADTKDGLLIWADQGRRFCVTEGNQAPLSVMQDVALTLKDFYYHKQQAEMAIVSHERGCMELNTRCKGHPLSEPKQRLWSKINKHVKLYGAFEVFLTEVDGECEREVEKEVIREKLVEVQLCKKTPIEEVDWLYDQDYSSEEILVVTKAITLADAINKYINPAHELKSISWSTVPVYCTANFVQTVIGNLSSLSQGFIEEYLRPVDMLLHFKKMVLLISEREANSILSSMQTNINRQNQPWPRLVHLSYAKEALEMSPADRPSMEGPTSYLPKPLGANFISILQLFNGETSFGVKSKAALKKLLSNNPSRKAAQLIPRMRGLGFMLSRSDLEDVCTY